MRLPPLPTIKDILRVYGVNALKRLSQNFLLNPRLNDKFVKAAGDLSNKYIVEVGPGPGGITRSILQKNPLKLLTIEKDERFVPFLEMLSDASCGKLSFIIGDILSFDMSSSFPEELRTDWDSESYPDIHIIGNLPFSISTPLIIKWLQNISEQSSAWSFGRVCLTLSFQKEVADRIVAPVLRNDRCRLSVMCQTYCNVKQHFVIKGSAFCPPPDVDAAVVTFYPLVAPHTRCPFKTYEAVVKHTFSSRQKYIEKCLKNLFPLPLQEKCVPTMLELSGLDGKIRPYEMSLNDFNKLCEAYLEVSQLFKRMKNVALQ